MNERFASATLEEVGTDPAFVFIQDYHLALAAATLRAQRPRSHHRAVLAHPWPAAEVFRRLPWRREVLEGMLANDLIGFHIRPHALNFLETVAETLEARVDYERLAVERGGRRTWVRHFPVSVDAEEIAALAESAATREAVQELRDRLGLHDCRVGLGVDRLDYTKGIPTGSRRSSACSIGIRNGSGAWRSSRSGCLRASSSRRTARCRSARVRSPTASINVSRAPAAPRCT